MLKYWISVIATLLIANVVAAAGVFTFDNGQLFFDSNVLVESQEESLRIETLQSPSNTPLTVESHRIKVDLDGAVRVGVEQNDLLRITSTGADVQGDLTIGGGQFVFKDAGFTNDNSLIFENQRIVLRDANNATALAHLNANNILVSNAYTDRSLVPANGVYSKGEIRAGGTIRIGTGLVATQPWVASVFEPVHSHPYALITHNHDAQYAQKGHTHTQYLVNQSTYPTVQNFIIFKSSSGSWAWNVPQNTGDSPTRQISGPTSGNGVQAVREGTVECDDGQYAVGVGVGEYGSDNGRVLLYCRNFNFD